MPLDQPDVLSESTDWGSALLGVVGIGFAGLMIVVLVWMLRYLNTGKFIVKLFYRTADKTFVLGCVIQTNGSR